MFTFSLMNTDNLNTSDGSFSVGGFILPLRRGIFFSENGSGAGHISLFFCGACMKKILSVGKQNQISKSSIPITMTKQSPYAVKNSWKQSFTLTEPLRFISEALSYLPRLCGAKSKLRKPLNLNPQGGAV